MVRRGVEPLATFSRSTSLARIMKVFFDWSVTKIANHLGHPVFASDVRGGPSQPFSRFARFLATAALRRATTPGAGARPFIGACSSWCSSIVPSASELLPRGERVLSTAQNQGEPRIRGEFCRLPQAGACGGAVLLSLPLRRTRRAPTLPSTARGSSVIVLASSGRRREEFQMWSGNGGAGRARRRGMVAVVVGVSLALGCSHPWIAQSTTNGRAFVARGNTMLYCYVRGRPICRPVVESSR